MVTELRATQAMLLSLTGSNPLETIRLHRLVTTLPIATSILAILRQGIHAMAMIIRLLASLDVLRLPLGIIVISLPLSALPSLETWMIID